METYTILREFADSWFLIAMVAFFVGTWVFAFWPSLRSDRDAAANIPFNDDTPKCGNDCSNCPCKTNFLEGLKDG